MKRRAFLAAAGTLAVSFLPGCAGLPVFPKRPQPSAQDAASWIGHAQGRYTLVLPRVEMGQNILTGLKQIACEELGVDWAQLDARLHGTASVRRVRATVGSDSMKDFALPLAQACATLREALASGQGEGVLEATPYPASALRSLRPGGRFVGRTPPLAQGEAIVRGSALYAADVRRPGMLYGRVLRAAVSPELRSWPRALDEGAVRAVPGFVKLVRDPALAQAGSEGIGILARTPGALDRIEAALAPQWHAEGALFEQQDIDAAIDVDARLAHGASLGRVLRQDPVARDGPWDVDLRIDVPLAAHAPIQPRAAVAEFSPADGGRLALWVGSQDVFYQRDVIARRLGLDETQITVHGMRVGGAFGGQTICTVALEAAVLARSAGAPVKLQWTRAQEFQLGFHRPPSSHRLRVRLKDGRIAQWWHAFASSHILFTNAAMPPWLQRMADLAVGDDGVARGALMPYRAAARRIELDVLRLPVFTGPWRGLGAGPNNLAIESAIDECARVAGADPLAFRLAHVDDPRLARVLQAAAEAARWGAPAKAQTANGPRTGRGIACGIYKAMSYAAVVAELEADPRSGAIRVVRLVCAHDCGLVVNPDQVRAQCEGNLVWGLGMVLTERLPLARGGVAAATFADSPIPRLAEVPPLQVLLVDAGGHPPTGAGETAIVAAAAAIANALRDATGRRITRLPVMPADVQGFDA